MNALIQDLEYGNEYTFEYLFEYLCECIFHRPLYKNKIRNMLLSVLTGDERSKSIGHFRPFSIDELVNVIDENEERIYESTKDEYQNKDIMSKACREFLLILAENQVGEEYDRKKEEEQFNEKLEDFLIEAELNYGFNLDG